MVTLLITVKCGDSVTRAIGFGNLRETELTDAVFTLAAVASNPDPSVTTIFAMRFSVVLSQVFQLTLETSNHKE